MARVGHRARLDHQRHQDGTGIVVAQHRDDNGSAWQRGCRIIAGVNEQNCAALNRDGDRGRPLAPVVSHRIGEAIGGHRLGEVPGIGPKKTSSSHTGKREIMLVAGHVHPGGQIVGLRKTSPCERRIRRRLRSE